MTRQPKIYTTHSEAETLQLGEILGEKMVPQDIVTLRGPLGAGKTVLVKGLVRGLGCTDPVTSPTFVLVQKYTGRCPIWHVDLYRLEHVNWMDLGIDNALEEGVMLIEWPERFSGDLASTWDVELLSISPNAREIRVTE